MIHAEHRTDYRTCTACEQDTRDSVTVAVGSQVVILCRDCARRLVRRLKNLAREEAKA